MCASHNPGYITASTVSALLTGKGNTLLKGAETFCKQIALERSDLLHDDTELNATFNGNSATEWGNLNESDAILLYEQLNFADVHGQQVLIHEVDSWLSCTPDGLVGTDGMLEVKCPYSEYKMLDYLLDSETLRAEYYDQTQFQLLLSGRKWCDLVAFNPHFKDGRNLVTVRIEPDLEWQERTRDRIRQAEELITEIIKTLNGGNPVLLKKDKPTPKNGTYVLTPASIHSPKPIIQ